MISLLGVLLVASSLVNAGSCKSLTEDTFTNGGQEYGISEQSNDGDSAGFDWQLSTDNIYFYKMLHTLDLEEMIKFVKNSAPATRRQRRSIFGEDDRMLIPKSSAEDMPYAASVAVLTKSVRCSGTLVGPKHVLTAAHCVYNGRRKARVKIAIAYENGRVRRRKVRRVYVTRKWKMHHENGQHDYAVLELRRPHSRPYMTPIPYDSSDGTTLQFNSFPGDKQVNTMWNTTCQASQYFKGYLVNRCDITKGMSGAGSYLKLKNTYVVRALLIASASFRNNKGRDSRYTIVNPLTRGKTKEICKWMRAGSDCKSFK